MTDLADTEHTTDWARFEQPTRNLAAHRLRATDSGIQSAIYGPDPSAETMIIDHRDGTFYRYQVPTFTPLGHGSDAWVFDISGDLQEPPTVPAPSPPPLPPTPAKVRPRRFRAGHRRRLAPLVRGVLIGAGVVAAVYSGLIVAAAAVLR